MRSRSRLFFATILCAVSAAYGQSALQSGGTDDVVLAQGWQFRSLNAAGHPETAAWHEAAVPGVVPLDLLRLHMISDPFAGNNEQTLQWIGLSDWEYRTTFQVSQAQMAQAHRDLVFDGLDTFADVFLNGQPVLSANNMFRSWTVDARATLRPGANELRVVFHSAVTSMLPRVKAMAIQVPTVNQVLAVSEEGIATDPYTRKAPYSYGWDWGPRFVNEGVWKPVHLVTWSGVRSGVLHIAQHSITPADASLEAEWEVESDTDRTAQVLLSASSDEGGSPSTTATVAVHLVPGRNVLRVPVDIPHPALWYPVGYGKPSRYRFSTQLTAGGAVLANGAAHTGLRSVELRREPDAIGESFTFVVNGKPVFAKGADVIPFDSFAPRVTPAQHRDILESAVEAHMNMIRSWGGGYYESDDFYDLADELGLMVWQEFMFGGAQLPGDDQIPGFRDNVRQEAEEQVERLRDHPSVVLWCGNNEVETAWFHWGDRAAFRKSLSREALVKVWQDYAVVMDGVLAGTVARLAPDVPYTPSSPHAGYDREPDVQNFGDMHYWQVWGQSAPISDYTTVTPRFMSEYGFQSFPEMATIRSFAGPGDLRLDSPVMLAHQKNDGGNKRIATYMESEYRKPKDFSSFVALSQVQQAEAIQLAADHLRLSRPRTMGSLYWQLNDCWPVASWSSIDYFGRWKALQFYSKRFYADVEVVPVVHDGVLALYAVNDRDQALQATLNVQTMSFRGVPVASSTQPYSLPPASATLLSQTPVAALLGTHPAGSTFTRVSLTVAGQASSERDVFFDHVKALELPAVAPEHTWSSRDGKLLLTLKAPVLARNVWVSFGDVRARLSDNSFDLLPGEKKTIEVDSAVSREALEKGLRVESLADYF